MSPDDPRVKDLQQLAWGLQSLTNKPGGRLPEKFKSDCYKLASRAIAVCSDVEYTEEQDFVERSSKFFGLIEAKKKEVAEVEEAEKKKITGKCYRSATTGVYAVGDVTFDQRSEKSAASKAAAAIDSGRSLSSTAGGARSLTASEVVARLTEDPEALSLCDMSLGDSDVETLCQALKKAGAELTSLDVSHNLLADVGVQRLVSALATGACPKLKELHVGFNSFGELGAKMLTGGLCAMRKTLVVHLDGNGAAPAACAADIERAAPAEKAEELAPASESAVSTATSTSADVAASETTAVDTQAAAAGYAAPAAPVVPADSMRVEIVKANSGEGLELRAVLSLPDDVSSSSDLDVDMCSLRIVVRRVSGGLVADAALPCAVTPDSAQVVFSRKRRTMTFTLHPADAAAAAAAQGA